MGWSCTVANRNQDDPSGIYERRIRLSPEEKVQERLGVTGYCPWCGELRAPVAISIVNRQYEWGLCNRVGCMGSTQMLVTTFEGWIISPRKIRGKYVFSRP